MSTYELTVDHVEGDVMRTTTPSGHTFTMDSKAEPGGEGATPLELLLAGIAGCSLIDVASILSKKRVAFQDLKAHVKAERREDYPRAFTRIELVYEVQGDVPEKALHRACELSVEKYCSVLATVREGPEVSWRAEVGASA
ncbi:MAG: OsmC family protein [Candidatus Thermoplasmatota archaeon]|nr:OsmC family protein [Candidatus Thermoplasmatota archaeon]